MVTKHYFVKPPLSLAQRRNELLALDIPNAKIEMRSNHELHYTYEISPSAMGRFYTCHLVLRQDSRQPVVFVMNPDLSLLAQGKAIPHIYKSEGLGTKLCLWWPKERQWTPRMKLVETLIPWSCEWLWYFEEWLSTNEWAGGGEHPRT